MADIELTSMAVMTHLQMTKDRHELISVNWVSAAELLELPHELTQ